MTHSFHVEIAVEYGVTKALLLEYLCFWQQKNKANKKHFHDGKYWVYNSIRAFHELFPYLSEKQIRHALKSLEEEGAIYTASYNKNKYDRTVWYSVDNSIYQKVIFHLTKGQMEMTEGTNRNDEKDKPIPSSNTVSNTTSNTISLPDFEKSDDVYSFSSENDNPSSENNGDTSIKERNKLYLPIAKRLSNFIRQTKQIEHTPQQLKKWANEIRKLVEGNGVPPDRINQALDWYEENAGGEYVPVIESGASLREKFIKLENAMERASKPSSQLPATGSRRYEKGKIDKHKYAKAFARRERLRKEGKL